MNTYTFRLQAVMSKADGGKVLPVSMVHVQMPATRDTADMTVDAYKAGLNEGEQSRFQAAFEAWQKSVGLADGGKEARANVVNLGKLKGARDEQRNALDEAQAEFADLERNIAVAEVLLAVAKGNKA